MKVMQVIHGLNTGGAETLVKEYALKLDKRKFEVVVLCFERLNNTPYEQLLEKNDIKVIYISDYQKFYKKSGLIFKIFNYFQKYLLVKRFIHKEKPDVLHTHLLINSYIKFAKPIKTTKIFHTVHSEPNVLWNFNNKNARKDYNAALYLVKKYNMRFICLHEKMKNEINKIFNVNNSLVLNNGIDFSKFDNASSKDKVRKMLNIPNSYFVLGHVGRFSEVKNHKFIVDVFKELYINNNNSFLLLVGSGAEKKLIEKKLNELKLSNNYLILENRLDIADILNAMDVFIFPSLFEGLGIALIEAQKAKLPCFVSNNIPESAIISNLVTTLSLDLSPKEWAKKMINYKYLKKIEINDEKWDMNKIIKELEIIYEKN